MDTTSVLATLGAGLALGLLLGGAIGVLWARARPRPVDDPLPTAAEREAARAELLRGLDRLSDQVHHLESQRAHWEGQLGEQVAAMRLAHDALQRETRSLSTALRRPQVRGRWGELHLRRTVELAGLVDRCDFTEQTPLDAGALRPDLVVHLAGGRSVVVDAKVPLDAFLDAGAAEADDDREQHLARHARQLRTHVDALGAKAYWRALPATPEFVVMFLPAEAFLAAALETQPDLLEHAASRQVVLATPTTLIALLRTVAQGWTHERLAEEAAQVQRLGRELHERLGTLSGHLDKVGRSLGSAVAAYNQAVGSYEGRVLVSARRMADLGVAEDALDPPQQVEHGPRRLASAGSADDLAALGDVASPASPAARRRRGA